MKKRGDKDHEIIIKRRSKKGHEEAHSGAWKVAFADFTLAMMALFMVLWIVQPQNENTVQAQAEMLTNPWWTAAPGSSTAPAARRWNWMACQSR